MRSSHNSLGAFLLVLSALWLGGCGAGRHAVAGKKAHLMTIPESSAKEVTLLAVNDMHATLGQFPRLAYVRDSLEAIYPDLLLVSGGDNQTGNPTNDMTSPKGLPMISLMNDVRFAVSAVGNHEFDTGEEGFAFLTQKASFPFISSNIIAPKGSTIKVKPYVIITTKKGARVGFVSLLDIVEETGLPASHPSKLGGFTFLKPLEHAHDYDTVMTDSVDIPIFLNHFGLRNDKKLAERLDARRYPLIIGGHSHTYVPEGTRVNGVYITQAKSHLKYATLIKVRKAPDGTFEVTSQNILLDKGGGKDLAIEKKVEGYFDDPALHVIAGELTDTLRDKVQIGYLFTDALRDESGADFALVNGGGIRVPSLPAGRVEVIDIYSADPFGNEGVLYKLTPSEIVTLLENHWRGDSYRICFPSGFLIDYVADLEGEHPEEVSIQISDLSGNPLDPSKRYTVAMNNYLSTTFMPKGIPFKSLYKTTAEITLDYLRKASPIPSYEDRKQFSVRKPLDK